MSDIKDTPTDMSADTPPAPRMSPAMSRIFKRIQQEDAHFPSPQLIPVTEARANHEVTSGRWNRVDESQFVINYFNLPTAGRAMHAVKLVRKTTPRDGTLLYLHGGGWVLGSIQSHFNIMARLAELTGFTVVGIDYALAPEAPFPGGLNDAVAAFRTLRAGAPAQPWLVAGDSAGANIAMSMMLDLRDAGERLPDAGLLFYGVFSENHKTVSHRLCGDGQFGLSTEMMVWYRQHYLNGQPVSPADPRVSPLHADLRGLPPIYLNAAGLDCLRDDSVEMAQRLAAAGVPHQFTMFEGVNHGFMQMSSELPEAMDAFRDAAAFVRVRF